LRISGQSRVSARVVLTNRSAMVFFCGARTALYLVEGARVLAVAVADQ
jgi:hypothetical protein